MPQAPLVVPTTLHVVGGITKSIERAYDARKPATIKLARGALPGVSSNRAPMAYAVDVDTKDYDTNVNETMSLLRFEGIDGTAIGALN